MDRSIDSIGSCSLDADSTDLSVDTSESLNFISPSATREDFTAGITERCRKIQQPSPLTPKLILNQPINHTTTYFDINSGKISTIVSRAGDTNGRYFNGMSTESFLSKKTIELQSPTVVAHANKKPSYLNLACCVNGYSNYTNYDSIERKEINKSREVSPIRPIISSISMSRQQRSNENLLSVPQPVTFVKQSPLTSITKRFAALNLHEKDTVDNASLMTNGSSSSSVANRKSFIQQRVEKLYGTTKILTTMKSSDSIQLNGNGTITHINGSRNGTNGTIVDEKENDEESMNSLPVMKHLRPEFCKQLQFMSSPKKSLTRTSTGNILLKSEQKKSVEFKSFESSNSGNDLKTIENNITSGNTELITSKSPLITKEISKDQSKLEVKSEDSKNLPSKVKEDQVAAVINEEKVSNNTPIMQKHEINVINKMESEIKSTQDEIKDGHYFLKLLHKEKTRILDLAEVTEKELMQLQSNPSTIPSEEIIGLVLAAIGKGRLLATKKFKQFEGLCQENLNPSSDGPQTLSGDLQGFWDMMMLQVDNIDAAFNEIDKCRENGWKKPEPPTPQPPKGSRLTKRPLTQAQSSRTKSNVPLKKPSTTSGVSEAAQKRDEQRRKLLEMKKKQKALIQNDADENAISVELVGDHQLNVDSKSNGNVEIIL
ncbi:CLUMA_CG012015, isoform A [Clunio marinus]|uniref:CLUMA_CG012015, isoform A n=1 Tax=Clunio marinus TaxID=568069 RepID=A0A1J1IEK5_9DIPT|nr:CLUMA_CG012015, isoform A [Clunio marinus]